MDFYSEDEEGFSDDDSDYSDGGRMAVYDPYGYRRGPTLAERLLAQSREAASRGAAMAAEAASKASKASMEGLAVAKRSAKAAKSSDLEKALLRATAPSDAPILKPDMAFLFKDVRSYARKAAKRRGPNPYEKTLHKVWNKMVEPDWRTTVKGVGVLHRLAAGAAPGDRAAFAAQAARLARARRSKSKNPKKVLQHKYFDRRALVGTISPAGAGYAAFAGAYFDFVMLRLATADGKLEDLPAAEAQALLAAALAISPVGAEPGAAAAMAAAAAKGGKKGRKGKRSALPPLPAAAAAAPGAGGGHSGVWDSHAQVNEDVEALWASLSAALGGIVAAGPAADPAAAALAAWWLETEPAVAAWFAAYADSMAALHIPVKVPAAGPSPDEVQAWLEQGRAAQAGGEARGAGPEDGDEGEAEECEQVAEDEAANAAPAPTAAREPSAAPGGATDEEEDFDDLDDDEGVSDDDEEDEDEEVEEEDGFDGE